MEPATSELFAQALESVSPRLLWAALNWGSVIVPQQLWMVIVELPDADRCIDFTGVTVMTPREARWEIEGRTAVARMV